MNDRKMQSGRIGPLILKILASLRLLVHIRIRIMVRESPTYCVKLLASVSEQSGCSRRTQFSHFDTATVILGKGYHSGQQ